MTSEQVAFRLEWIKQKVEREQVGAAIAQTLGGED
jgi:hypothetical protein